MKEERAEAGPKVGRGGLVSKCGILLWPHIIKILYYGFQPRRFLAAGNHFYQSCPPRDRKIRTRELVFSACYVVPVIPGLTRGLVSSRYCPVTALHYT